MRRERPRCGHGLGQRRAFLADRFEAIEPDQPLRRGGAAFLDDEAVPAAHASVQRHEPLADGKRGAIVGLGYGDLCEAAGKGLGGADLRGKRIAAGGQSGVLVADQCADPAHAAGFADPGLEIVAQRSGQRALAASVPR